MGMALTVMLSMAHSPPASLEPRRIYTHRRRGEETEERGERRKGERVERSSVRKRVSDIDPRTLRESRSRLLLAPLLLLSPLADPEEPVLSPAASPRVLHDPVRNGR